MVADYYNRGTAAEPMPAELKSLLSTQEASSSVPLFPALTAPEAALGVHLLRLAPTLQVHTDCIEDDLEDDEAFARAIQSVKARWNSPV
jgi:hypothetical protein